MITNYLLGEVIKVGFHAMDNLVKLECTIFDPTIRPKVLHQNEMREVDPKIVDAIFLGKVGWEISVNGQLHGFSTSFSAAMDYARKQVIGFLGVANPQLVND